MQLLEEGGGDGGTSAVSTTKTVISNAGATTGTTHLVFQRYRHCRILLDEKEWVSVGTRVDDQAGENVIIDDQAENSIKDDDDGGGHHHHCGLLVYVSFAVGATKASVQEAAHTILHLPFLTTGVWGDGTSEQLSLMHYATTAYTTMNASGSTATNRSTSLVLCPQANLIGKLKGRSQMQYHGQIDKEKGRILFHYLASCLIGFLLERQCELRSLSKLPTAYRQWKQRDERQQQQLSWQQQQQSRQESQPDPSIAPSDLFRTAPHSLSYSAWDGQGMPTHTTLGEPLTKSAVKKLKKLLDAHVKRHDKWMLQQAQDQQEERAENPNDGNHKEAAASSTAAASQRKQQQQEAQQNEHVVDSSEGDNDDNMTWWRELDSKFCAVVVGSFGKRQGLELTSDMGPFCHVIQV
ncbi:hypothetical protein ACA910_000310 [Epithemia clementina (nom. ined.)]